MPSVVIPITKPFLRRIEELSSMDPVIAEGFEGDERWIVEDAKK